MASLTLDFLVRLLQDGSWRLGFALSFPNMPRLLMIPMTVLIAAIAGGFIGRFLVSFVPISGTKCEVIITIVMNYIVLYGGNAFDTCFQLPLMKTRDSIIDVGANAVYQTGGCVIDGQIHQNEHRDLLCHHREW